MSAASAERWCSMTNPVQADALVEVVQADRDAAADAVQAYRDRKNGDWQQRIRDGKCDDGMMVQAFARHRLASQPSADAEVEPVAWRWRLRLIPGEGVDREWSDWRDGPAPNFSTFETEQQPLYAHPPADKARIAELERLREALRYISDFASGPNSMRKIAHAALNGADHG